MPLEKLQLAEASKFVPPSIAKSLSGSTGTILLPLYLDYGNTAWPLRMPRSTEIVSVAISSPSLSMREGLRTVLVAEKSLHVTDAPRLLPHAIRWIEETRPDIVLYDVMSTAETFTFLAAIDRSRTGTKTIILVEDFSEEFVLEAAHQGAVGCLLRSTSPRELIKAIYVTCEGELWLSRRLLAKLFRHAYGRSTAASSPASALTTRQRQIAELVSTGMSNRDIAAKLLITDATVRAHLNDIFKKLGLHDRVELALLGRHTLPPFSTELEVTSPTKRLLLLSAAHKRIGGRQ